MTPKGLENTLVGIQAEEESKMTDTRKITAEYRLFHWAQVIREQKGSGQSIKAFCKAAGFHPNNFFYWQRKLREAACEELLPATQNTPKGWILAHTVEMKEMKEDAPQTLPIEIGNFRVLARTETESELLAKVCKVLATLC
jgi:putative transposase